MKSPTFGMNKLKTMKIERPPDMKELFRERIEMSPLLNNR